MDDIVHRIVDGLEERVRNLQLAIKDINDGSQSSPTFNRSLMFSSETDRWNTPDDVIEKLGHYFTWDLDVCASGPNVCERYFDEDRNGLAQAWRGLCWMNPPYGRKIGEWVQKAVDECIIHKANVVCLLPARTDTKWWHDNIGYASLVVLVRGRFKFGGSSNSAPFPSAFVVFGSLTEEQEACLSAYGWAIHPKRM